MPIFKESYLRKITVLIFEGCGMSPKDARIVADHLVSANLAGHDSHGVISIESYIDRVRKGHLDPRATIQVVSESPTSAAINGNWGFGFIVSSRAVEMAIEKAGKNNVAALTIFQQGHIGRLADYTIALAQAGMIGLMTSDSGRAKNRWCRSADAFPALAQTPFPLRSPATSKALCLSIWQRALWPMGR